MKGVEESGIYPAVGHVGLDLRREVGDDHYSMVVRTKEQILTRGEGEEEDRGWDLGHTSVEGVVMAEDAMKRLGRNDFRLGKHLTVLYIS